MNSTATGISSDHPKDKVIYLQKRMRNISKFTVFQFCERAKIMWYIWSLNRWIFLSYILLFPNFHKQTSCWRLFTILLTVHVMKCTQIKFPLAFKGTFYEKGWWKSHISSKSSSWDTSRREPPPRRDGKAHCKKFCFLWQIPVFFKIF